MDTFESIFSGISMPLGEVTVKMSPSIFATVPIKLYTGSEISI